MPDFGAFNQALRARLPVLDLYFQLQHLSDINEDLTKELASLRSICGQTDDKIHLLQNALHTNNDTAKRLISVIDSTKQERDSIQSKLVSQLADLNTEFRVVESEKEKEVEEYESMNAKLKASMDELSLLEDCIESNKMALFPAQTRLFLLAFEIEMLQILIHEKVEYSVSVNASSSYVLKVIDGKRKEIGISVQDIVASKISLDTKTSSVETALAALNSSHLMATQSDQHIKRQLNEARDRIGHIEITDQLISARETEVDGQILAVKEQLQQQREDNSIILKRFDSILHAQSENILSKEISPRCPTEDDCIKKYDILSPNARSGHTEKKEYYILSPNARSGHTEKEDYDVVSSNARSGHTENDHVMLMAKEAPSPNSRNHFSYTQLGDLKKDLQKLNDGVNAFKHNCNILEQREHALKSQLQKITITGSMAYPWLISSCTMVITGIFLFPLCNKQT